MDQSPKAQVLALVRGHRLTDMITAAVRLGIPDLLTTGPADAAVLAASTGTHAPTLYRLLRTLAAAGVLHEDGEGRFSLTAAGAYLATDHPESLAGWVSVIDQPVMREAWSNLEHSVRTGQNSFKALHGEDVWEWRRHEPAEEARFDRAMTSLSAGVGTAVAKAFDFSRVFVVADIAGGTGSLLAAVLTAYPHLRGILFDQPAVTAHPVELERAGLLDRARVAGGSFFDGVPAGADVYLMKAILHDWEDPEATAILRNIRAVIPQDGSLLVVERVIGAANDDLEGKMSDLHMLVMPGGRERTETEWSALLEHGGFRLQEIRPIPEIWQILVARPAG